MFFRQKNSSWAIPFQIFILLLCEHLIKLLMYWNMNLLKIKIGKGMLFRYSQISIVTKHWYEFFWAFLFLLTQGFLITCLVKKKQKKNTIFTKLKTFNLFHVTVMLYSNWLFHFCLGHLLNQFINKALKTNMHVKFLRKYLIKIKK